MDIEQIRSEARSIESVPDDAGALNEAGREQIGKRIYIYYCDSAGQYWYRNLIETDQGIATEYEAIFGKRKAERKKRK